MIFDLSFYCFILINLKVGLVIFFLDMNEIINERLWEIESIFILFSLVFFVFFILVLVFKFLLWYLEYFEFSIDVFMFKYGLFICYLFRKYIE